MKRGEEQTQYKPILARFGKNTYFHFFEHFLLLILNIPTIFTALYEEHFLFVLPRSGTFRRERICPRNNKS